MKIHTHISPIITCAIIVVSCSSEKPSNFEPQLLALSATDITRNEATLHGSVTTEGDTELPVLRFRYGATESMENLSPILEPLDNQVSFQLTGLEASTTYHFALQGNHGSTTLVSNQMSLTTDANTPPTLGSLKILSQGPMSIILGYDITDNGGEKIQETGCYYLKESENESQKTKILATTTSPNTTSMQKVNIGHLERNTTYTIWAFASNRGGESISEPLTITTTDAVTLDEAGQLTSLLGDALYEYTTLTIHSPLNGDDIRCIRQMMGINADGTPTIGKLCDIDLTEAQIVEGGKSYDLNKYTQAQTIGQGMFANCTQLIRISLPTDAISIEKDAFKGCSSLAEITIPASVTSIVSSSDCPKLTSINVSEANSNYHSKDGVLLNATEDKILWFPMGKTGEYTVPSTIKQLGDYAFQEVSITHFILPDDMTDIGMAVFYNSKVKEVTLPNKLKTIRTGLFQNCNQLAKVNLGASTELISDYVFDGCPLTDIYIKAVYPPVCNPNAFTTKGDDFTKSCTLHVPKGRKAMYRNNKSWKVFTNIVEE